MKSIGFEVILKGDSNGGSLLAREGSAASSDSPANSTAACEKAGKQEGYVD